MGLRLAKRLPNTSRFHPIKLDQNLARYQEEIDVVLYVVTLLCKPILIRHVTYTYCNTLLSALLFR